MSSNTGQGAFGAGDITGDGLADILLGSGPNGSAYLTKGQPYLEAITNLQLDKLASNTGYMLDGLAKTNQGSLRSIGDFNGDGYGDFISIQAGPVLTTVRLELGANTQEVLADYPYNFYSFTVSNDTQISAAGDINGDGFADIALLLNQDLSSTSQGAGSTVGVLYGRLTQELPVGSGFGYLSPVNSSSQPLTALPGVAVSGGLSDAQPAIISVGNLLYSVVKGDGVSSLWFAQSSDAGQTWTGWTDLTASQSGLASNFAPSLAYFNNKLYLAFLNTDETPALSISSWDPSSNTPVAWTTPTALSDGSDSTSFSSKYSPQLIDRGDALGLFGSMPLPAPCRPPIRSHQIRRPPWAAWVLPSPGLPWMGDPLQPHLPSPELATRFIWLCRVMEVTLSIGIQVVMVGRPGVLFGTTCQQA